MTRRRRPRTAEPPEINDFENLKSVATADANYGWPWDIAVVFVAYAVVRLVGLFRRRQS